MRRIHNVTDTFKALLHRSHLPIDPLYANPRSLYASGEVERRVVEEVEDERARVTRDAERAVLRNLQLGDAVEQEDDVESRPRRDQAVVPDGARGTINARLVSIRFALRSPESMRTAIVLKEILDPPLALRPPTDLHDP